VNLSIAENIRSLRGARKMTQAELAKRIGVTDATISAYEVGTRTPSFEALVKLAQVFRVSTDNLLGFSNRYVIDVSKLNARQRAVVQEIATVYEEKNRLVAAVHGRETDEPPTPSDPTGRAGGFDADGE
jgi:transcriptional regulator with XRE-family HTH domain